MVRKALPWRREHRPDVVLMDVRMPGVDGIEATRRITATEDSPRVLVLTTFDLDEHVFAAMEAGASGFLLKDVAPDDLVHAVRVVARGEAMLAPALIKRLLERFAAAGSLAGLSGCCRSPVRTRGRRRPAGRPRMLQRRDRGRAVPQRGDREDLRLQAAHQARSARPRTDRGLGLRVRPRPSRWRRHFLNRRSRRDEHSRRQVVEQRAPLPVVEERAPASVSKPLMTSVGS